MGALTKFGYCPELYFVELAIRNFKQALYELYYMCVARGGGREAPIKLKDMFILL